MKDNPEDFMYADPCGCVVRTFADSQFHTSHLRPEDGCAIHCPRDNVEQRDDLMRRAKAAVKRELDKLVRTNK